MQALGAAAAVFTVGAVVAIVTSFAESTANAVLTICAIEAGLVAAWTKKLLSKFGQRGLKLLNIHAANILALGEAPSPSIGSFAKAPQWCQLRKPLNGCLWCSLG